MFIRILSSAVSALGRAHQKAFMLPCFLIAISFIGAYGVFNAYNSDQPRQTDSSVQINAQNVETLLAIKRLAVAPQTAIQAATTQQTNQQSTPAQSTAIDTTAKPATTNLRLSVQTVTLVSQEDQSFAANSKVYITTNQPNNQYQLTTDGNGSAISLSLASIKQTPGTTQLSIKAAAGTPKGKYTVKIILSDHAAEKIIDSKNLEVIVP